MNIRRIFHTIDTHTAGGPTRIVTSGIPSLVGNSIAEKVEYFKNNYDSIRTLLLTEPRGHREMYGAVITEAVHPDADLGVFFVTVSGYLSACVHSSIGVATALLETGSITPKQANCEIIMETPVGLISLQPNYQAEKLISISLKTRPVYVHSSFSKLYSCGKNLEVSLIFSGVFFVLIDARQLGMSIATKNLDEFVILGKEILREANRYFEVRHPENPDIHEFSLAMFYERVDTGYFRDVVISRMGNVDRSPCGAGAGAMATYEFVNGRLDLGDPCKIESIIGTQFVARITCSKTVGTFPGSIPSINGTAFITGFHQFILESEDPLINGFVLA